MCLALGRTCPSNVTLRRTWLHDWLVHDPKNEKKTIDNQPLEWEKVIQPRVA